ncbi:MAG: PAS domain S-box protein [Verrucomicrobiota bacterium]
MAVVERLSHCGSWELDLIQLIDIDSNPLRWSDEMFRIAGYEPGAVEVSNELFFSLVHSDDRAPIRLAVAAAIRERRPYSILHRLVRPDGEERIIEETAQLRFSEVTGQPVQVIGTAHDLTGRRWAEETIWESEQRFSSIFEHAPSGMILISPEGHWLKVNRSFCDLVGYSEAVLLNRSAQDLVHPADTEMEQESLRQMLAGEIHSCQAEKRYRHSQGHFVSVLECVSLIRNGHGQPRYLIAQSLDITGRKQAEAQKREEEDRYVRQRNALISFSGGGTPDDEGLNSRLRQLTEAAATALNVARVSVWRYNADRSSIRCVDLYEREEGRHSSGVELSAAHYPHYFEALATGAVIAAGDVHLDGRTCEFSECYLRPLGISSMLDAPIHLAGVTEGVLCHEHIGTPRCWTADEETFAVAVANVASLDLEGLERQRAEKQLRESKSRYRTVVEWSPEAMFVHKGGEVLFVNPAAVRMFGGTIEKDLLVESEIDLLHPYFRDFMAGRVGNAATSGDQETMREERLLKLDGTPIDVEVQGASIFYGGEPAILTSMRDITARKQAERDLQRSQALLRMAGRIGRMGAWAVDLPDFKLAWSEEVCAIHEMPPGRSPTIGEALNCIASEFRKASLRAIKSCLREGTPFDIELQIITARGRRVWVRSLGEAERDAMGVIRRVQGNMQDITGRKTAETALGKAHSELVGASRRAGMAEVATSVLHNVGNVLNSVNISAGLVEDRVKKSESSSLGRVVGLLREHEHDLAAFITGDSRGKHLPAHLARLSEHLLAEQEAIIADLVSLRSNVDHIKQIVAMQQNYAAAGGVREQIDVLGLVEDSIRIAGESLRRHSVEVVRQFEVVPPLNSDKHKIVQILVNLLSNAKHACQESGRPDKRLTVRVSHREDRVRILVIDNGMGIAPENLTHIYNFGFTTRKNGHGFGLHSGAIAATEMGGSLSAQSAGLGMGATFILELPCLPPESVND